LTALPFKGLNIGTKRQVTNHAQALQYNSSNYTRCGGMMVIVWQTGQPRTSSTTSWAQAVQKRSWYRSRSDASTTRPHRVDFEVDARWWG